MGCEAAGWSRSTRKRYGMGDGLFDERQAVAVDGSNYLINGEPGNMHAAWSRATDEHFLIIIRIRKHEK